MLGTWSIGRILIAVTGLLALQAIVLAFMGQPAICPCGVVRFWVGTVSGPENSQQLTDWYTFSHVIHGIALYFLIWLVMPRAPVGMRLALAVGLEVSWEVFENTPFVIERYRQQALAQGYFGDSIVNSLTDTFAAIAGFLAAYRLPIWGSVALVLAMELFVGFMINDNLILNIIQLIHPMPAISNWQLSG